MWGMDAAGNGGLRGTCCPGLSPGHRRAGSPPRLGPSGGQSLLRVTKTERTVHVLVPTNTTQAVTHFNTQLFPVSSRGERGRALTTPCLLCCPPSTGRGGCRCPAGPACEEEKQSRCGDCGWSLRGTSMPVLGRRLPRQPGRSPWLVETGGAAPTRKGLSRTCSWVKTSRVPGQTRPQAPTQAGAQWVQACAPPHHLAWGSPPSHPPMDSRAETCNGVLQQDPTALAPALKQALRQALI